MPINDVWIRCQGIKHITKLNIFWIIETFVSYCFILNFGESTINPYDI